MHPGKLLGAVALLIAFFALAEPARADLIITVEDQVVSTRQGGTIDVFIQSDNPLGDLVNFFQYQFQISLVSGSGRFEFQPFDSSALANDPNYIFAGLGTDPFGSVMTTDLPNDTFAGGDNRPDLDNTVVGSDPLLITRLIFGPGAGTLAPTDGSVFSIALVPPSRSAADQMPNSPTGTSFFYYHDSDADSDLPNGFTSVPGTITVNGTGVVPEPGSFAALACGLATLAAIRNKNERRRGLVPPRSV